MMDEQIYKLLKKGCWSSAGWKDKLDLTREELADLEAAGQAHKTRVLTHDQFVAWGIQASQAVDPQRVREAFVWSLGSRELQFRSALGSYAYLRLLPKHKFKRVPQMKFDHCETCGAHPKVTVTEKDFVNYNFERYKWGGVRHGDICHAAFDLELFNKLPLVVPTPEDWRSLKAILTAAADPTTGKSVSTLKKAVKKIIKSNDYEAVSLLLILSYTGVLATETHPGYDKQFIRFIDQDDLSPQSDMHYPLNCWKGPGYRADAVKVWFPEIASM